MRFFNEDDGEMLMKIAGEMYNLETGKQYYDNGQVVVYPDGKAPPAYPTFVARGVRRTIRAAYGVVVVPSSQDVAALIAKLRAKLQQISSSQWGAPTAPGQHHFATRMVLETGCEHFMVVKGVPTVDDGMYDAQRRLVDMDTGHTIGRYLSTDRFTWFFYRASDWLYQAEHLGVGSNIPLLSQLVTVWYDAEKQFVFPNNTFLTRNLLLTDLIIGQGIKNLSRYGPVGPELETIKGWESDLQFNSLLMTIKQDRDIPESMPAWGYLPVAPLYCRVRNIAPEIIRQHRSPVYAAQPLQETTPLTSEVYRIEYHDFVVDNSLLPGVATPTPSDCCAICATPLYDDCYAVFPSRAELRAYATCGVCLHSRFTIAQGVYTANLSSTARGVICEGDTIGRFRYPRRWDQVLDHVDSQVVTLLRVMRTPPVVFTHLCTILLFNYDLAARTVRDATLPVVIGCPASALHSWITFAHDPRNEFYQRVGYTTGRAVLADAWVVPLDLVM